MDEQQPWHRLFGLTWIDFFRGLPVTVELEKDLSHKQQFLDVLIIRKEAATLACELPDGFEELASYNLVSFKSHRQTLSAWSLQELIGHYVNLRKQVSPSMHETELLPPEDFHLYAVSVRFPQALAGDIMLESVRAGVYDVSVMNKRIRVVAINQIAASEQNALLHLFSSRVELLKYGIEHYRMRSSETSTLLYDLIERLKENDTMPDALEEFAQQTIERMLKKLPPKRRLEGISKKELLELLSPEDRLEGLSPEKRLEGLSPEKRLEGLSPEKRLEGLSKEERDIMLRLLMNQEGPANSD